MSTVESPPDAEVDAVLAERVAALIAVHGADAPDLLGARFDAGLAFVHHPVGLGGLGLPAPWQARVEELLLAAGAPAPAPYRNPLGIGTAVPTLLAHGSSALQQRHFRPAWTAEEIWCQLFSEPGAGSDLAGLATRAVLDGDTWTVNGQKVWTSFAHVARWGLLLARTDPDLPKHQGLTMFVVDMQHPGVEVRPLRQATGGQEFNEVFFTDVTIPDAHRVDLRGRGWDVARTTLFNERSAVGARPVPREDGHIAWLADLWRSRPDLRTHEMHGRVTDAWIRVEALRLANERIRQLAATGRPGLEGSGAKVAHTETTQVVTRLRAELDPEAALRYDAWDPALAPPREDRVAGYHYLRSRPYTVEGGTTQILLSQIADRVLGMPREPALAKETPWSEIPR
ncbi:acyl-CoA dehydrogenase family protein [Nocardioides dubius]|uniref:Acyl-CoA dehydrogenase n=1 Tax=Nocardioides dubius TaxID=317019 RepID=A0ABN1TMT8_9ACTN